MNDPKSCHQWIKALRILKKKKGTLSLTLFIFKRKFTQLCIEQCAQMTRTVQVLQHDTLTVLSVLRLGCWWAIMCDIIVNFFFITGTMNYRCLCLFSLNIIFQGFFKGVYCCGWPAGKQHVGGVQECNGKSVAHPSQVTLFVQLTRLRSSHSRNSSLHSWYHWGSW